MSLVATPPTLTPSQLVTLSAVVVDPGNDLAGGTLVDDQGHQFGAFQTPGGQGTFTYALTWSALAQQALFDVPASGGTRTLTARFFDARGNTTSASLELRLQCDDPRTSACDSVCVDLSTHPEHCGQCRRDLSVHGVCLNGQPSCATGQTVCGDTCTDLLLDENNCGGCGKTCDAWAIERGFQTVKGLTCNAGRCEALVSYRGRDTCSATCSFYGAYCFIGDRCPCPNSDACSYYDRAGCALYSSSATSASEGLSCDVTPSVDRYSSSYQQWLPFRELLCNCR